MSFIAVEEGRRAERLAAQAAAQAASLSEAERTARAVEDRITAVAAELRRRGVQPAELFRSKFRTLSELTHVDHFHPAGESGVLVAVVDSTTGYVQVGRGRYRRVGLGRYHPKRTFFMSHRTAGLPADGLVSHESYSTAYPSARLSERYASDEAAVEEMHRVLAHYGRS